MPTKEPTRDLAVVYTHPTCGYCDMLKSDLQQKGIDYEEIDVSKQPEMWGEVERLSGGDRITPVLVTALPSRRAFRSAFSTFAFRSVVLSR